MAKFRVTQQFKREWHKLPRTEYKAFDVAWRTINASLDAGKGLPPPPFVQKWSQTRSKETIYEVRFSGEFRATFNFETVTTRKGTETVTEQIIVWRRIGDHHIEKNP